MLIVDWIMKTLYRDTVKYQSLLHTLLFLLNGLQFL